MGIVIKYPQNQRHMRASTDSSGYKSDRSSWRGTPVARSTASTLSGGTSSHCETAWGEMLRWAASLAKPPATALARSNASRFDCMMRHESLAFSKSQAKLGCLNQAPLYRSDMTLGERIKAARKARKMSQAELGAHFGISSQAVSQWETRDDKGPERDKVPQLAEILNVSVQFLLGKSANPSPVEEIAEILRRLPIEEQKRALRMLRAIAADSDKAA